MRKLLAIAFCLSLTVSAARAGVFLQMVEKDLKSGKEKPAERVLFQDGKVRNEDPGQGRHEYSIFRDGAMYQIDDKTKSYRVFDKAAAQSAAAKMQAMMQQMKERIAKMPPQQRAAMEKAMGGHSPMGASKRIVDAIDTGQSINVNGKTCRVWNKTHDGKLDEQICVVPYRELPGSDEVLAAMENMAKLFESMSNGLPASGLMAQEVKVIHKINGYPIYTRDYIAGKLADSATLVKTWAKQPIPPGQFDIPTGYKQRKMPGLGAPGDDDEGNDE
jgi:hypothetical protein